MTDLRGSVITVGGILSIAAGLGGLPGAQASPLGLFAALFATGQTAFLVFKKDEDNRFKEAADFGSELGEMVLEYAKALVDTSHRILRGEKIGSDVITSDTVDSTGDIRDVLRGGFWLEFKGFNYGKAVNGAAEFLLANVINHLWRQQKIFIIGGPKCSGENWR